MTNRDLKRMVENYLDKLEYTHPLVNSERFIQNSIEKWACKELLRYIAAMKDVPFTLTPQEILTGFADKMKNYACMNAQNSLVFATAQGIAEFFLEESWRLK